MNLNQGVQCPCPFTEHHKNINDDDDDDDEQTKNPLFDKKYDEDNAQNIPENNNKKRIESYALARHTIRSASRKTGTENNKAAAASYYRTNVATSIQNVR